MVLRNVAFITAVSAGAKIKKPEELWRLFIDGKVESTDTIAPLTQEEYEAIKKAHGIN